MLVMSLKVSPPAVGINSSSRSPIVVPLRVGVSPTTVSQQLTSLEATGVDRDRVTFMSQR